MNRIVIKYIFEVYCSTSTPWGLLLALVYFILHNTPSFTMEMVDEPNYFYYINFNDLTIDFSIIEPYYLLVNLNYQLLAI